MRVNIEPRKATLATFFVALMVMAPLATLTLAAPVGAQVPEVPDPIDPDEGAPDQGTGDPFWLTLEGFSTKSGYRMVFAWETESPIGGLVRWGFSPNAMDNIVKPVGQPVDKAGLAFYDVQRAEIGRTVYWEVIDQLEGTISPTQSFRLGNAWNSDYENDGVYTINAVMQLDSESFPPEVPFDLALKDMAMGVDVFAERVWDMTDGYLRIGKVLITDTAFYAPGYQFQTVPVGVPPICAGVASEDMALQHTLADFIVSTQLPFDSHTWGRSPPSIDHACTAFYIGRIGQLVIPWEDEAHIGAVMSHEFGHYAMGLPDLYNTLQFTDPRGCAQRNPNLPGWDASVMHNSGGWTGVRWDLTELDRVWEDCDRSVGTAEVSWDEFRRWYPEVPATTSADIVYDDSDSFKMRDNPDGDGLDIYLMDQRVALSNIDHFIAAPRSDDDTGVGADVQIVAPDRGASIAPSVAEISGFVDRQGAASAAPVATLSADPESGDPALDVTFTLGGSDPDGTVVSWDLAFGDGSASDGGSSAPPSTRTHTYTADGTYTAVLTLTDDTGLIGTAEVRIVVGGGGAMRIGTDPAGDKPASGACPTQGTSTCRHEWTAGAKDGLDLVAAHVEDVGDNIRFSWKVVDSDKFFVEPSGDPASATDESHIISLGFSTSFETSPATRYQVTLNRDRGSGEIRSMLWSDFVAVASGNAVGAATHDAARDTFYVDVPKSEFSELDLLSTLSGLSVTSSISQYGTGDVSYFIGMDSLDVVENDSYTMESGFDLLGAGPSMQVSPMDPPSSAPADPEISDPTGDAFIAGTVVGHTDIEAAWFEHDAEYVYVGMKVVDIPTDPTTTTNIAYHVQFIPDWTTLGWGPASPATFQHLQVTAVLDPGTASLSHQFSLQVIYTGTTGNTIGHVADLPGSDIDPSTDVIWWVIPKMALQNPPANAKLTDFAADTAVSSEFVGTLTWGGVLTDAATGVKPDYTLTEITPLAAGAGGPYRTFVGYTASLESTVGGGESPYTCEWSTDDDGLFSSTTTCNTDVSFATAGDKIVRLAVTDAGGNETSATGLVVVQEVTDERVELSLSGDLLAVAPVATGGSATSADWLRQVDFTGRSGSHTLTATWYDADGTVLDKHAIDVVVSDGPAPFVTIDQPDADSVVAGVVDVGGAVGHGANDGGSEATTGAFAPDGLFTANAFAQKQGSIAASCVACEGVYQNGTEVQPPNLARSNAWLFVDPATDGTDGRWLSIPGMVGADYELVADGGSPMDIWFFADTADLQADATGQNVGWDATKNGVVPPGTNWAFVYMRRPTAENATLGHGVDDTAILTLTPPLTAPQGLAGGATWESVNLAWSAPEWDGGSALTGYKVHRDGNLVATLGAGTTTFSEAGLTPEVTYLYTVSATNADGDEGPQSAPLSLTTGNDATAPSTVSDLVATAVTNESASLSWTAAADAESGISHYRVTRDGILVGTPTGTTFSEANLGQETTYVYEVAAVNGQGIVGPASSVTVVTLETPVTERVRLYVDGAAIGNVTVTPGDTSTTWAIQWDTRYLDDGTYTLVAEYDDGRGGLDLAQVVIEVDNVPLKPDVTVSSPVADSIKQTPIRFEGDWTTIGDQSAPLGASAADTLHPQIDAWYGDTWVQETLHNPAYRTLLRQLDDLQGYVGAYPTNELGKAIVVLLEGPVPSNAPTGALGVPLRYVPNAVVAPLTQTVDTPAPSVSLDEFEDLVVAGAFTGPQTPGVQQGAGPGSAIQFAKPGSALTWICSTSYLYEDPTNGKYYLSTAGHCLYDSDVGDSNSNPAKRDSWVSICILECASNSLGLGTYVRLEPNATYHPVAYGIAQGQGRDFGLIDIPESLYQYLRPHLTLWGGPTQFERPLIGDPVVHYGHGCGDACGPGVAHPTQGRLGVTLDPSPSLGHFMAGWVVGGDSGSALGTAFPRPNELLVGDGATGVITHSVQIVGAPIFIATDLEVGLGFAGMTHLRLVTEDEDIRLPGLPPVPDAGVTIDTPPAGDVIDRFSESPVTVSGTGVFNASSAPNGNTKKTYYLHRSECGSGNDRFWMDQTLLAGEHGGGGCGSALAGAWPLTGKVVDIHPADPLPDGTTYIDPARDVVASIYVGGNGGINEMLISYEARLSYGSTVVAETKVENTVKTTHPLVITMDPLVDTIPPGAPLEFSFVVYNSPHGAFVRHGGANPTRVEIPTSEPDARVELAVDDPTFNATSLLPTTGNEQWSASWDVTGMPEGNHTLYARAVVDGVQQGDVMSRTVNLTGTPPPEPPVASFGTLTDDLTVFVNSTSIAGSSPITSWSWDFGDGATANTSSASHTYGADGTYTVTLTVTDGNGLSDSASQDVSVEMGIIEYAVQVRLVGPAGEAFGWTDVANPLEGESGQWELLWDPATKPTDGNYTLEIRMLREGLAVATNVTTFKIDENVAPLFAETPLQAVEELQTLVFDVVATDADPEDVLTLSATSLPPGASFVDNGDGTGTVTWTPDETQLGVHTASFSVSDGRLGDTTTVSINVFDKEEPPVLDPIGDFVVAEGEKLVVPITASDLNGDALSLVLSPKPNAAVVAKTGTGSWTFTWTPGYQANNAYTFTAKVTDGLFTVERTFNVTVTDVDVPPQWTQASDATALVGVQSSHTVRTKDLDGDAMTLTASGLPAWATFTDQGAGRGTFQMSPPPHESGEVYSVLLTVSSTNHTVERTIALEAFGYMQLSLTRTGTGFVSSSPGENTTLGAFVTNNGNAPGWVTFSANALLAGWTADEPTDIYLLPGETQTVNFVVVPGDSGSSSMITLRGAARDFANVESQANYQVRIPLTLDVSFSSTSAVFGTTGTVAATFLNGDPASGVAITVTDVHQLGMPFINTASGTTAADGTFTFTFDVNSQGGQLPGSHTLYVEGARDGRTDSTTASYTVTV